MSGTAALTTAVGAAEKKATNYAYLIIFIIAIILVAVAAGFAANSAAKLKLNNASTTDPNLKKARTYLISSAVIGIVVTVFLIIVTFMFSATAFALVLGLLIFSIILAIIIAVLCWLAAVDMKKSTAFTNQGSDKSALTSAYIAAGLATGAAVFGIVGIFLLTSAKNKAKAKIAAATSSAQVVSGVPVVAAAGAPVIAARVATPAAVVPSNVTTSSLLGAAQQLYALGGGGGTLPRV